jgi:hypothetical protein
MTLDLTKRLEKGALSDPTKRITAEEYDADLTAIEGAVNGLTDNVPEASLLGRAAGVGTGVTGYLDATVLIVGALLLIGYGALGIALATLTAYAVRTALTYAYVRRLIRLGHAPLAC